MSVHVRGHPIHTMLVAFPIGLLAFATVFDVIFSITGGAGWYTAAFYDAIFGVVMAVPTAIFGFFDFTTLVDPRARDKAVRHAIVNVSAVLCYLFSIFIRGVWGTGTLAPMYGGAAWRFAFALSIAGFFALMVGGWLGGDLVYRLRVGIGIEPAAGYVRKPLRDEAGNLASDFPDFPNVPDDDAELGQQPGLA